MKFSARTTKSPTNAQNTGQIAFFIFSPPFSPISNVGA
jgi:hypothetical protein